MPLMPHPRCAPTAASLARWAGLLAPAAYLELGRAALGAPWAWGEAALRLAATLGPLALAWAWRPRPLGGPRDAWPWPLAVLTGAASAALAAALAWGWVWAAWLGLGSALALGASLYGALARGRRWPARGAILALLALTAGGGAALLGQIESRYAEEEFLVAAQGLFLSGYYALAWAVGARLIAQQGSAWRGPALRLDRRALAGALAMLALAGLGAAVRSYQRSFYAPEAPAYPGIAADTPFVVATDAASDEALPAYDAVAVYAGLLERVEANPLKGAPEYALLAIARRSPQWAATFRETLLREAAAGRYTDPAQSIKAGQHEAALRAYFLWRITETYPDLFSPAEWDTLRTWFAAINRRALSPGWVDWLYALAFAERPRGPYENQEIGPGLLAILEATGYAPESLGEANRGYLALRPRGWDARVRVTDDAFNYQREFITNAWLQSLYAGRWPADRARLSFEWLLLQAPPDGAAPSYNFSVQRSEAWTYYVGAALLDDPRYLWLAGRALEAAQARGEGLYAIPGAERAVTLDARAPTVGSALLYGDAGLPNQVGPLAPDKIVLRDGWARDDAYLLLNLRFSGWHRYKATNTIALLQRGELWASDADTGERAAWLPAGRAAFRDKRIPRENLNGLLIPLDGLSAALHVLAPLRQPWAQDPPHYAEVIAYATGPEWDMAHTRLSDWRGWQHDRRIYLVRGGGPVVVVDEAHGPANARAALAWQFHTAQVEPGRARYPSGAEAVILAEPGSAWETQPFAGREGEPRARLVIRAPQGGRLNVTTVFLSGDWAGASIVAAEDGRSLTITRDARRAAIRW